MKSALLLTSVLLPAAAWAATAPGPDWAFLTPEPNAPASSPPAAAPAAQPGAPAIVVSGKAGIPGCSVCHAASGVGAPETANLRALHMDYITRQTKDFASAARGGPLTPPEAQKAVASLTDAEIEDAAKYYAGLSPMRSARVVEAASVPKTTVGSDRHRVRLPGNEMEPVGKRIVEIADTKAAAGQPAYVAYVAPGTLAAGETVVKGSKTEECASCHGDGLKGSDDIPRIAGRSPVYIARQLYSFKNGVRTGDYADVMKSIVSALSDDDILATAAYVGSLDPS